MTKNSTQQESKGTTVTKSEVRAAVAYLQTQGYKIPGIMKLKAYIGHGSQERIKRFRDEVLKEKGDQLGDEAIPDPISQLSGALWEQMQEELADHKAEIQAEADEKIEEYKVQAEAEASEKEVLSDRFDLVTTELATANNEIARLNQLIVEKDQDLTKTSTQLEGRDLQLAEMKKQFGEYKKLNTEYSKQAVVDGQAQQSRIVDLEGRLAISINEKDALADRYMNDVHQIKDEHDKQWKTLTSAITDMVKTTSQTQTSFESNKAALEELGSNMLSYAKEQGSNKDELVKLIGKMNSGIMKYMLLLPDMNKNLGSIKSLLPLKDSILDVIHKINGLKKTIESRPNLK